MTKEVFRHDSVERLSSPVQLSKLLVVIQLRGWIVLCTLALLVVGILTWSFAGSIPIITTGKGILLAPSDQYALKSPVEAIIEKVGVKSEEQVLKGQPLMQLSTGQVIHAPEDGKIFQIEAGRGEQVKAGAVLMWIETAINPKDFEVYCFIPVQAAERIKPGMKTTVELGVVDTQKYGQLVGEVKEVVPYAVSKDSDRLKVIPSERLRADLTKGKTAMLVTVKPKLDAKNPSGLVWTFGKGPPKKLAPGSLGQVRITIESKRPISYLIPILS